MWTASWTRDLMMGNLQTVTCGWLALMFFQSRVEEEDTFVGTSLSLAFDAGSPNNLDQNKA